MSSRIVQVADAMVTLIQEQEWAAAYAVAWVYAVRWKPEDFAKTGRLTIAPTERSFGHRSRGGLSRNIGFSIALQKRHNGKPGVLAPVAGCGEVDDHAESLAVLLMGTALEGDDWKANAVQCEAPVIIAEQQLAEEALALSVLNVTYQLNVAPP